MTTASPADPLGYDAFIGRQPDGTVDISPDGRDASGYELAVLGILARSMDDVLVLTGAPGDVVPFGRDVRGWVGEAAMEATGPRHAQELAVVYAREPTLDPGSIAVALSSEKIPPGYDFTISVTARTTTQFPIALVLGVNSVTVELLAQGQ